IDHSWVGDLIATLTSPAGTTVTLMSRPGGTGNSGNNFCQTVLSDSASSSIQNIAIADAPWTGTFRPAQPLSAFSGEIANGNLGVERVGQRLHRHGQRSRRQSGSDRLHLPVASQEDPETACARAA